MTARSSEMRRTATAALNKFCGFTYNLARIEVMILDKILANHESEHGFIVCHCAEYAEKVLGHRCRNLECKILGSIRLNGQNTLDNRYAIAVFGTLDKGILQIFHLFLNKTIYAFV